MGCAERRMKDDLFSFRKQFQMVSFIRSRNISAVEDLFRAGFKPEFKMPSFLGRTSLHIAVSENLRGITDVILRQEGVDVDAKDDIGMTPVMIAITNDFYDVVKLLMDQEPPPRLDVPNKFGKRAVDYIKSDRMQKMIDLNLY